MFTRITLFFSIFVAGLPRLPGLPGLPYFWHFLYKKGLPRLPGLPGLPYFFAFFLAGLPRFSGLPELPYSGLFSSFCLRERWTAYFVRLWMNLQYTSIRSSYEVPTYINLVKKIIFIYVYLKVSEMCLSQFMSSVIQIPRCNISCVISMNLLLIVSIVAKKFFCFCKNMLHIC